jgi:hypothetical protein
MGTPDEAALMLHVTNGRQAADCLRSAAIDGVIISWDDVLHEGPVPAGLRPEALRVVRARFIAERGWATLDRALATLTARDAALEAATPGEIVLWFEHDLYDQLQLLDVLDRFPPDGRSVSSLTLVQADEYLGMLTSGSLRTLFDQRAPVTPTMLQIASRAWAAVRSPDPRAVLEALSGDTTALPFLSDALRRLLEEYPAVGTGLSRSERQVLEALVDGPLSLSDAFRASHHAREEAWYLGDTVFAWYLERLSGDPVPLVQLEDGGATKTPRPVSHESAAWARLVRITDAGRDVLEGRTDLVAARGIDRWVGGVHLSARTGVWRWSGAESVLTPDSVFPPGREVAPPASSS